MFHKIILIFALSFIGTKAHAQSLWKNSNYGMTKQQVQSAFPEAVTPEKASVLYGGETALLTIKEIEMAGRMFNALFYFKDSKLTQVSLNLQDSNDAKSIARALYNALKAKYGPELGVETSTTSRTVTWLSGKTNIILNYSNHFGYISLGLHYQMRISALSDKL